MIIKCAPFNNGAENTGVDSTANTIRVVVWPKRHTMHIPPNERSLFFAMCEFSGHLILVNEQTFADLTEQHILDALSDCKLTPPQIQKIKDDLTALFSSS